MRQHDVNFAKTIKLHILWKKYLQKDKNGNWAKNPDVPFDEAHDHGIYSYNNGEFPFLLKPYKYMLLRNRHDARADLILLELTDMDKWEIIADGDINEKGDLIDHDTQKVLMHCTDTIMDKDMNKTVHIDKTVTQWIIVFSIKKVLKFRKNAIDWDKVFGDENEDE